MNDRFKDQLQARLTACSKVSKEKRDAHVLGTDEVVSIDYVNGPIGYYWDDFEPFIKIFSDGDNLKDIAGLGTQASYLFFMICKQLKPRHVEVRLHKKDYFDFSGTKSDPNYYIGLNELIDKGFIEKIDKDNYEVNPTKFFNGRRQGLIKDSAEPFVKAKKGRK